MRLTAEIAGARHTLQLTRDGARVVAEIDGRRYELEARETERGLLLLRLGGRVYECRVEARPQGGAADVHVGRGHYEVALADPKHLRGAGGAAGQAGGRAKITSPMPGKVVRVLVEVGADVEAGQGLVVVEAMKMQNELKSPKGGRVVELHARPGAAVDAGEVLVVVE